MREGREKKKKARRKKEKQCGVLRCSAVAVVIDRLSCRLAAGVLPLSKRKRGVEEEREKKRRTRTKKKKK